MNSDTGSTPRVLIEVDAQFVPAVIDYIAALRAGATDLPIHAAAVPAVESATAVPVAAAWTADEVAAIARDIPYEQLGVFLDAVAAAAGTFVKKQDIEIQHGLDGNMVTSQLGGLTRRYGLQNRPWFFDYEKRGGPYWYRMTPEVAEWWSAGRK